LEINEKPYSSYAALVPAQFLFGSLPVIAKIVFPVVPALAVVGFRVGITALILVAVQAVRGRLWLKRKDDYWRLAVLSFFGIIFNQTLFTVGLSFTKASNASLLAVTIPVFALTVGAVLGKERLRPLKIGGIVLAAVGVLLLIDPRNASFSSQTTIGDIMIVANSLSYGIYVATSKRVITRNGTFRSMMWVFLFASLICVPVGVFSLASIDIAAVPAAIWALIVYIAVLGTAAPYLLNAFALARVNPSTVAVFVYMQPLIGFLFAVVFLNEQITPVFVLSASLIFIGVFLVTRKFVPAET
jgi:drug/metabolite transporter (DMT)-like permease